MFRVLSFEDRNELRKGESFSINNCELTPELTGLDFWPNRGVSQWMLDQDVRCFGPTDRFVRRKKKAAAAAGGKKAAKYSKDYTEGWVEFRDKRIAKRVAASLHNTPIGARRRSPFRYDLWNLKVRL